MAAAATDKFVEVGDPGSATTLDGNYTVGDSSITVVSTTNWPTATGVVFAIDEVTTVNGEQVRTAGTYNVYQGTVASSTSITNVSHISGTGTDRNYTAGTSTRVYIVVSSEIQNRLVAGLLVSLDQDGTLKSGAVDNAAVLASDVVTTAKILNANVTTAKIADAAVTYAKLLSTIFSGQVSSAANAGTAGGTNYYIDLGGIKLCWTKGALFTAAASTFTTKTVTLPTSFFSTVQHVSATLVVSSLGGGGAKVAYVQDGYSTTTVTIVYYNGVGSSDSIRYDVLTIGT